MDKLNKTGNLTNLSDLQTSESLIEYPSDFTSGAVVRATVPTMQGLISEPPTAVSISAAKI